MKYTNIILMGMLILNHNITASAEKKINWSVSKQQPFQQPYPSCDPIRMHPPKYDPSKHRCSQHRDISAPLHGYMTQMDLSRERNLKELEEEFCSNQTTTENK